MRDTVLNAHLNPDRCLAFVPLQLPDMDEDSLPPDWLSKLATNCALLENGGGSEWVLAKFLSHIKDLKEQGNELERGLKLIYQRWIKVSAQQQSENQVMAVKLYEGAGACAPGFHDRVNTIIGGFYLPQHINDFLLQLRQSILQTAAAQATDEVHANNTFTIVANNLGYGIPIINRNDKYRGSLSNGDISEKIHAAFKENYTLPWILRQLGESIYGFVSTQYEYGGRKRGEVEGVVEPYVGKPFDSFVEFFPKILPDIDLDLLFVKSGVAPVDEDELDLRPVIDLNWLYIYQQLMQFLLSETYFNLSAEEVNVIEYYLEISQGNSDIHVLLANGLIANQADFINLLAFFRYASVQLQADFAKNYLDKLPKKDKLSTLKELLGTIQNESLVRIITGQYTQLLSSAIHQLSHPSWIGANTPLTDALLRKNRKDLSLELNLLKICTSSEREKILTMQFSGGHNLLMLAVVNSSTAIKSILSAIAGLPIADQLVILEQADSKDRTALTLAIEKNPEVAIDILAFINKLPDSHITAKLKIPLQKYARKIGITDFLSAIRDNLSEYKLMHLALQQLTLMERVAHLTSVNHLNENALVCAAYYYQDAVGLVLDLMKDMPAQHKVLILTTACTGGYNALISALSKQHPQSISSILNEMRYLPPDQKASIFKQVNIFGYSALMYAVHNHQISVPIILDFLKELPSEDQEEIIGHVANNRASELTIALEQNHELIVQLLKAAKGLNIAAAFKAPLMQGDAFGDTFLMRAIKKTPPNLQLISLHLLLLQELTPLERINALTHVNCRNENALVLATYNNPEAIGPILKAMEELTEEDRVTILTKPFGSRANFLIFSLYNKHQQSLASLLEAISQLSPEKRAPILMQITTDGDNALMLAISYHPSSVPGILALINDLSLEQKTCILLQKTKRGNDTALSLALKHDQASVSPISKAIKSLAIVEGFNELWTQVDEDGNTALMNAIKKIPINLELIISHLLLLQDRDPSDITAALTCANNYNENALVLAAYYNPVAVGLVLNAMEKIPAEARAAILNRSCKSGFNALIGALVKKHSKSIASILEAIRDLSVEQKATILKQVTSKGNNALMLAVSHHPSSVPIILGFISELSDEQKTDILGQKSSNGDDTALILALRHDPASVVPLLKAAKELSIAEAFKVPLMQIDEHGRTPLIIAIITKTLNLPLVTAHLLALQEFEPQERILALTQVDNFGQNALFLSAYYHTEALGLVLNAMQDMHAEDKATILTSANTKGVNALICALFKGHQQSITSILDEISKLSPDKRLTILKQAYIDGCNALMCAISYHPTSVPIILGFIKELSPLQQADIFEQKTMEGTKSLLAFALNSRDKEKVIKPLLNAMKDVSHIKVIQDQLKETLLFAYHQDPQLIVPIFECFATYSIEKQIDLYEKAIGSITVLSPMMIAKKHHLILSEEQKKVFGIAEIVFQLARLKKKIEKFEKAGLTGDESSPHIVASKLYDSLCESLEQYQRDRQPELFKDKWIKAIGIAHPVLSAHRGYKNMVVNLLLVVGTVGIFGIALLIRAAITASQPCADASKNRHSFFCPIATTDSEQHLKVLSKSIDACKEAPVAVA